MEREFFQDSARHFEALLGRLIGIGGGADGDLLAGLNLAQLLAQQLRGLLLDVDLPLEVGAVAHLHELVGVARVAIFAGELASAIGIDGPSEGHAVDGAAVEQGAAAE